MACGTVVPGTSVAASTGHEASTTATTTPPDQARIRDTIHQPPYLGFGRNVRYSMQRFLLTVQNRFQLQARPLTRLHRSGKRGQKATPIGLGHVLRSSDSHVPRPSASSPRPRLRICRLMTHYGRFHAVRRREPWPKPTAALAVLYGYPGRIARAREYVAAYAHVPPQQAARAVLRVLHEVEQVLTLILDTAAALARRAQSGAA